MSPEETEDEFKTFLKDFGKTVGDAGERDQTLQIFSDNAQVPDLFQILIIFF